MIRFAALMLFAGGVLWGTLTTTTEAEEISLACDLWMNGRNVCTLSIPMVSADR